jgi:hypothetical protein
MAISTGSAELIKMMHERLPESGFQGRVDLLEIAAEFHQQEVLDWLNRDATVVVRELLVVFALEYKLADSLELAFVLGGVARMRCRRRGGRVQQAMSLLLLRGFRQRAVGGRTFRGLSRPYQVSVASP